MSREAMKLALEAAYLAGWNASGEGYNAEYPFGDHARNPEEDAAWIKDRDNALREALAGLPAQQEPEFFAHSVEQPYDWSDWVCPDPKSYLMKCCDCGLVHEAQFGVVRYKSETEREDCDMVDDPNLQAVFRMRRSEQWSPEDTAHRAGGLPMEQPAQQEPVAWGVDWGKAGDIPCVSIIKRLPGGGIEVVAVEYASYSYTSTPAQRTWVGLTDEEKRQIFEREDYQGWLDYINAIEAKLRSKNEDRS